jgi:hypothetical protein
MRGPQTHFQQISVEVVKKTVEELPTRKEIGDPVVIKTPHERSRVRRGLRCRKGLRKWRHQVN